MPSFSHRTADFAAKVLGPTLIGLLLTFLLANAATRHEVLACDRAEDVCRWSRSSLFASSDTHAFPVTAVRDVRYVDKLGKNNQRARSVLVFASGNDFALREADTDDAASRHTRVARFFGGGGATLLEADEPSAFLLGVACLGLLGTVAFAIRGTVKWRRSPTTRSSPPPPAPFPAPPPHRWRKTALLFGGFITVGGLAQIALVLHATKNQGTLEFDCRGRCRFQGTECLPGGRFSMTLDPGDYTVDLWASHGEALWLPRRVTVRVGEHTTFVCDPP